MVREYLANGGKFSAPVTLAADAAAVGGDVVQTDPETPAPVIRHRLLQDGFRLQSKAFMLTFHSKDFTKDTWLPFSSWVRKTCRELGARRWAACLEGPADAASQAGSTRYHLHAYFWWTDGVGLRRRNTDALVFDNVRPRVDVCTCQAGRSRGLKLAATHGLWYVVVMKVGTEFSDTNFMPWRDFVPRAEWVRSLWEAHKLTNQMYASFSSKLRVGYSDRKRDLSELDLDARRRAVHDHVKQELARLAAQKTLQELRSFPEVDIFLNKFADDSLFRRPILAVVGGTNLGKSILAADVLQRVAKQLGLPDFLEVTVEADAFLDFTDFDIRQHAGVLLDGVGDVETLKLNREVLQGRPKTAKAARSPTMRHASVYTLCRRAVVATFDLSATNLHMLDSDHWLSNPKNVIQLRLTVPAWESGTAEPAPPRPRDVMRAWSVNELGSFAKARDLAGPASVLAASGVNGADLLTMDEATLVHDVRMTPFAARKVLRARDSFLAGK